MLARKNKKWMNNDNAREMMARNSNDQHEAVHVGGVPSPSLIRQRAAEVRQNWTPAEFRRRAAKSSGNSPVLLVSESSLRIRESRQLSYLDRD